MQASDIISIIALVVATGALLLEIRRWVESGPRLKLNVMSDVETIGRGGVDKTPRFAVIVTNRGEVPTTITHMMIYLFPSKWARLRRRASATFFVTNPQPGILPAQVDANTQLIGMADYDEKLVNAREKGELYAGIAASHSDKTYLIQVAPKKKKDVTEES